MGDKRKPKRDKPKLSYALGLLNQPPRFFSLEWTFAQPYDHWMNQRNIFILCIGPYIYVYSGVKQKANDDGFSFSRQSSVFEATGTFIRGIVSTNHFVLAWGGPYIARIVPKHMMERKAVCVQDVISTGREIVSIRTAEDGNVEIYYANGTVEIVEFVYNTLSHSMKLVGRYRLPLEPTEKVTAVSTKLPQTLCGPDLHNSLLIGTSHGRILVIDSDLPLLIISSGINCPIRQLLIVVSKNPNSAPAIMLLLENGSLVYCYNYREPMAPYQEIKGRFTCIYQSNTNMFVMMARNWNYIFAGDRDGHLTILWISDETMKIARSLKHVAANKITLITDANVYNLFIGTEMGDYQLVELMQFTGLFYDSRLPQCIADSRCYFKTSSGWYFMKDDQLWQYQAKTRTPVLIESSFDTKDLRLKYLCCTAVPEREIAATYNQFGLGVQVRDYGKGTKDFHWEMNLQVENKQIRIIKVVLMQSYVLLQYEHGTVELLYIDVPNSRCLPLITRDDVQGTITSAACLEDYEANENLAAKVVHLMISYRNGKVRWIAIRWNVYIMVANVTFFHEIDIPSGYVVSMITSSEHLGSGQCITLNHNGTASIVNAEMNETKTIYKTGAQQDLSHMIGRGHALFETSEGILAAGFKQHTLNVCWIYMCIDWPPQYAFLFSVDTRSSRLPYTLIEQKKTESDCRNITKVIISYYSRSGIKELLFPIIQPRSTNGIGNSGIITSCYVEHDVGDEKEFGIYTGDSSGKFCVWSLEDGDHNIRKPKYYTDFKLNGAVTCIHAIKGHGTIAVATSQGYLYFYNITQFFQLLPMNPIKMSQKVNFLMDSLGNQQELANILVFLEDGTVEEVSFKPDPHGITPDFDIQKLTRFAVATKMAIYCETENRRYIVALGIDGILRRTQLPAPGNETVEIKWEISVIKQCSVDEMDLLMVGDRQGWVYVTVSEKKKTVEFEIDCYHRHEVIDIICSVTKDSDLFSCSLDITGTVVIRKLRRSRKAADILQAQFPVIWASPVPSPRKIVDISARQIMVVGRGVATKSF